MKRIILGAAGAAAAVLAMAGPASANGPVHSETYVFVTPAIQPNTLHVDSLTTTTLIPGSTYVLTLP